MTNPYGEDPRLQIDEPVNWKPCDHCGEMIEGGEEVVVSDLGTVHEDCWSEYVWENSNASKRYAGEME